MDGTSLQATTDSLTLAFLVATKRPIGAIVFGEMGDRVGRKYALIVSIAMITVPSVLMGMLPGYATWGTVSPVFLVLLRMMQGLSVGGQLAGSYVLSIEQSSQGSRGFRGSVCDASSVRIVVPLIAARVRQCKKKCGLVEILPLFFFHSGAGWWFLVGFGSHHYCSACSDRRPSR
jgi:MFS family permease